MNKTFKPCHCVHVKSGAALRSAAERGNLAIVNFERYQVCAKPSNLQTEPNRDCFVAIAPRNDKGG